MLFSESSSPVDISVRHTHEGLPRTLHFSIIISTHNRAEHLPRLIEHLNELDISGLDGELIVVDNASKDATSEVLAAARSHLPLVTMTERRLGKNFALNSALHIARGELLIFTDDDVHPTSDWVRSLVEAADRHRNADVFCTRIQPRFPENVPWWFAQLPPMHLGILYARFDPRGFSESGIIDRLAFGPSLAIRAEVVKQHRYDPSVGPKGRAYVMGGETELLQRLRDAGHHTVFVPGPTVYHLVRVAHTRPEWIRQRAENFGRGGVRHQPQRWKGRRNRVLLGLRELRSRWRLQRTRAAIEVFEETWKLHYYRGIRRGLREAE